ncbi:hypothetical protein [Sciscionella sediminilitoris]|uniref:hypothetical protein n=1 Tax=Sciscionella sediminilitoris TaxID=1445613 RepID=UPI0004DFA579|nr:hypothetical protein [Sciscionella sp. SE31]
MTSRDELINELVERVRHLETVHHPVDVSGLPLPIGGADEDPCQRTDIDGLRWQVGREWTVIAQETPDHPACIFLRDRWGQDTGDVECMTAETALQLAGALVAAAKQQTDELGAARRRKVERTTDQKGAGIEC